MLRITVQDSAKSTTFKLEGKLAGPWVEELERTWRARIGSPQANSVLVDLCGVATIDARGKELLGRMHKRGADLIADAPMTRYIVEEVTGNQSRHEKEEE